MLKLATKFAPRREAFENAHRAGFGWAELWLGTDVLGGWEAVAAEARAWPLGYALHFPNRLDQPGQALEQTVQLYRALDSRCLVLHPPMCDRHAEALVRLAPEVRLAVENQKFDRAELLRWAETSPGLALDVEHLWLFTVEGGPLDRLLAEVRALLDRFGDKLRHVHLPGYLPGQRTHRPMYCSRDMVFAVWSLLSEAGFDGLVVSETNPEYQGPQELRMDVLLFEAWQAQGARAVT
jgi:hypothetical protein